MKSCAFASLAAVLICSCGAHTLSELLWLGDAACSCRPRLGCLCVVDPVSKTPHLPWC